MSVSFYGYGWYSIYSLYSWGRTLGGGGGGGGGGGWGGGGWYLDASVQVVFHFAKCICSLICFAHNGHCVCNIGLHDNEGGADVCVVYKHWVT